MKYAEINNNTIIKIHNELPTAWKNISNFHVLSDLELSDLSWSENNGCKFYQVVEESQPSTNNGLYIVSTIQYTIDEENKTVLGTYTVTPVSNTEAWEICRRQRKYKLSICDWTHLSDVPLDIQTKAEWASYRQSLRDITNQSDPFDIIWPTEPAT